MGMGIAYLCDGQVEDCNKRNCYYKGAGKCKHTEDIHHAKNFTKSKHGEYFMEGSGVDAENSFKKERVHDQRS